MTTDRPTDDRGVMDAEYLDLLQRYLDGDQRAREFRSDFYAMVQRDTRLGDTARYEILQRIFFACEDLVLDEDLPGEGAVEPGTRDGDEIDEPAFRERIAAAARDLATREDWEAKG